MRSPLPRPRPPNERASILASALPASRRSRSCSSWKARSSGRSSTGSARVAPPASSSQRRPRHVPSRWWSAWSHREVARPGGAAWFASRLSTVAVVVAVGTAFGLTLAIATLVGFPAVIVGTVAGSLVGLLAAIWPSALAAVSMGTGSVRRSSCRSPPSSSRPSSSREPSTRPVPRRHTKRQEPARHSDRRRSPAGDDVVAFIATAHSGMPSWTIASNVTGWRDLRHGRPSSPMTTWPRPFAPSLWRDDPRSTA